jgi:hypothetical protein
MTIRQPLALRREPRYARWHAIAADGATALRDAKARMPLTQVNQAAGIDPALKALRYAPAHRKAADCKMTKPRIS